MIEQYTSKIKIKFEDFPFLMELPNSKKEKILNEINEYFLKKHVVLDIIK